MQVVADLARSISANFTDEVFRKILAKCAGLPPDAIAVTGEIKPEIGSKKGDSYLSTICRFTAQVTTENESDPPQKAITVPVIIKFIPKNVARSLTFRTHEFFDNEAIFYDKVWAAYATFKNSKGLEETLNIVPNCLHAQIDGADDFIAMEDLNFKKYRSVCRANALDYEHTITAMKLFAKFHGLGLAMKYQRPEQFEEAASSLKETYFSERLRGWYENFQLELFKVVRDAVQKELPAEYLEKLDTLLGDDFFGKLIEICEKRGPLSVATHGDAWAPNFLFKYCNRDGETIEDAVLIDFQLSRYAPLSCDLAFFLYACVEEPLRTSSWDKLMETYHEELISTMKKLGSNSNRPTLEMLRADMKENALLGVGMAMEAITMSLIDDEQVADVDMMQGEKGVDISTVWIIHPFQEAEKRQRLANVIKHGVDMGFV